jgi:hypothetical protein
VTASTPTSQSGVPPSSLTPQFGGWAVVSRCPKCGMPIWAEKQTGPRVELPITERSCDCHKPHRPFRQDDDYETPTWCPNPIK